MYPQNAPAICYNAPIVNFRRHLLLFPGVRPAGANPGAGRRFAPEYAYSWVGAERDLEAFSNYRVQEQEDPGEYRLPPSGQSNPAARRVRLAAEVCLLDRRDGAIVRFSVERTVALTPQPLPELPLRTPAPPVRYFNKGCWELHDRSAAPYLSWRYEGKANAKIGYGCAQVTGRAGALRRRSAGDWVLVVLL